jgi:DNA helicase-2/ATP-dependent DNA helicase PcrA
MECGSDVCFGEERFPPFGPPQRGLEQQSNRNKKWTRRELALCRDWLNAPITRLSLFPLRSYQMPWNDGLIKEQEQAASHSGSHARLLAGPGTGKTLVLTRRILHLMQERQVPAEQILALTFTRAAAHELRQRVSTELASQEGPRIATLHAFALRQLLRNSQKLATLPQPLRIADDWEERNVILADLKNALHLDSIRDARELFHQLSADWESLAADAKMTPDAHFVGAWKEHREIYGYTLRSELVYQLKRSLEQIGDFELEAPTRHLLVDEYQDLNLCDLAVIRAIAARGVEVFIAGDDDQSIYGFRKAYPEGIRRFPQEYKGAQDLPLHICKRCDPEILHLAEFVANLDTHRLPKVTVPEEGRPPGDVVLLRFADEAMEARGIARLCRKLMDEENLRADEILILLRADTKRAFSRELEPVFAESGVPLAVDPASHSPLDEPNGRQILALLRLANNPGDHLALTTLLRLRRNGIGPQGMAGIYDLARTRGERFAQTVSANPSLFPRFGGLLHRELAVIEQMVDQISAQSEVALGSTSMRTAIDQLLMPLLKDEESRIGIGAELLQIANTSEAATLGDLLNATEAASVDIEPELVAGRVNVLTMHKAKGLTANAVIVMACEDEHIPGRQEKEPDLGDERRLLYVSLTRAKHKLYVTYCDRRGGQQRMLGRNPGNGKRTLTRFLRDAPLHPTPGAEYLQM